MKLNILKPLGSKLPSTSKNRKVLKSGKKQNPEMVFDDSANGDGFNIDSNGIRIGNFYWIIGGLHYCRTLPVIQMSGLSPVNKRNKNSYLWSISKRKWIRGPPFAPKTGYLFHYACSVALNSSAVLFVGITEKNVKYSDQEHPLYVLYLFGNQNTAIYNFETKTWIKQDPLGINVTNNESHVTCSIYHAKVKSR